jgi:hypothetical protein
MRIPVLGIPKTLAHQSTTHVTPLSPCLTGVNLAMAKSVAGQALDLINIMAYDAGNTASTGEAWGTISTCDYLMITADVRAVVLDEGCWECGRAVHELLNLWRCFAVYLQLSSWPMT